MTEPVYAEQGQTLYVGDCREVLQSLEPESVQTVVTSPPYFCLRDNSTATWAGGDVECDHRSPTMRAERREDRPMLAGSAASNADQLRLAANSGCGRCGAVRSDRGLGLESNPLSYISAMVDVFDAVRRVLRPDGLLWVVIGDTYSGAGYSNHANTGGTRREDGGKGRHTVVRDFKPKDLIGIPWRLAFALQAAGWWLRSDCIWAKSNPLPSSVRDRPTSSHEYVFLLTKSERYFYDWQAIAEPCVSLAGSGNGFKRPAQLSRGGRGSDVRWTPDVTAGLRNKRDVWTVPVRSGFGGHSSTYPTALIRPCILAGSREGDTVLDPFSGSGTTSLVAKQLGRRSIGIELNPDYVALSVKRLQAQTPAMLLGGIA